MRILTRLLAIVAFLALCRPVLFAQIYIQGQTGVPVACPGETITACLVDTYCDDVNPQCADQYPPQVKWHLRDVNGVEIYTSAWIQGWCHTFTIPQTCNFFLDLWAEVSCPETCSGDPTQGGQPTYRNPPSVTNFLKIYKRNPGGSIVGPDCVCKNETHTYTVFPTGCGPLTVISWSLPNGWTLVNQSGNNVVVTTGNAEGDFNICATIADVCGQTVNICGTVHVGKPDIPTITHCPSHLCPNGNEWTFFVGNPRPACATEFVWKVNGVTQPSTGTSMTFAFWNDGPHDVCVQAKNSCGTSLPDCCEFLVNWDGTCGPLKDGSDATPTAPSTFLTEKEFEDQLSINPNPGDQYVKISIPQPEIVLEMMLVNPSGQIAQEFTNKASQTIDVSSFDAGAYYLVVRTPYYTVVRTVTVIR